MAPTFRRISYPALQTTCELPSKIGRRGWRDQSTDCRRGLAVWSNVTLAENLGKHSEVHHRLWTSTPSRDALGCSSRIGRCYRRYNRQVGGSNASNLVGNDAYADGRSVSELNPLLYSLDVFVPFVNLHQEHFWWPDKAARGEFVKFGRQFSIRGSMIRSYLWLQIIAG